jgi:hypothetical protein
MFDRQRIVTTGITGAAAATLALVLWLKPWASGNLTRPTPEPYAEDPIVVVHNEPAKGQQVDVVFAVDTTGSMGGLLDGAKRTVWSIANHIRDLDQNADLRIGLVAYRDIGDAYVTKPFALSDDLDAVFAELSSYQAQGGGDVPENVDAALYEAVHKMAWRTGAKKMIFLVGDAPPASRGDVPRFEVTAREAANRQITINAIRAGHDGETARAWQQIAMLGGGEFSSIQQDGGVQHIATPYDAKLAELSARIDSTTVVYGDGQVHRRYAAKSAAAAAAPSEAKADRATYYAKKPGKGRAAEDIVGGYASGAVSIDALDEGMLPGDLRGKSKAELDHELKQRAAARDAAQKELAEVARQRAEYLKNHKPASEGFDDKVKSSLAKELAK